MISPVSALWERKQTTVRTVHYFTITREGDMISCRVCADGFLYNMVRAMVGTCVYASEGKLSPDDIPGLLEGQQPHRCRPHSPSARVVYDQPVVPRSQPPLSIPRPPSPMEDVL